MTIKITRGPRGDGSPVIAFVGVTSDGSTSADTINNIFNITPQINITDSDSVDVADINASINSNTGILILFNVHYSEWEDREGNSFASAIDVVSYLQNEIDTTEELLEERVSTPRRLGSAVGVGTTMSVGVGSFFEYNASYLGGSGYFWDRNGFPSTMEVSRYDRRKISGIITTTGAYQINYDVANINGITSSSLTVYVL